MLALVSSRAAARSPTLSSSSTTTSALTLRNASSSTTAAATTTTTTTTTTTASSSSSSSSSSSLSTAQLLLCRTTTFSAAPLWACARCAVPRRALSSSLSSRNIEEADIVGEESDSAALQRLRLDADDDVDARDAAAAYVRRNARGDVVYRSSGKLLALKRVLARHDATPLTREQLFDAARADGVDVRSHTHLKRMLATLRRHHDIVVESPARATRRDGVTLANDGDNAAHTRATAAVDGDKEAVAAAAAAAAASRFVYRLNGRKYASFIDDARRGAL